MKTSIELTTDQKIKLQKEMGVVADELVLGLSSELENLTPQADVGDVFVAFGKTHTVSGWHPDI
ncbi:MAG: hypothetical protein FWF57_03775 [Defluviitaleaceae bacterium]|nr:hypothetical protein [Defluviitaleaceae bacterium]